MMTGMRGLAPFRRTAWAASVVVALTVGGCGGGPDPSGVPTEDSLESAGPSATSSTAPSAQTSATVAPYSRLPGVVTNEDVESTDDPLARWQAEVPVQDVRVTSSLDGSPQPALWAPPPEPGRPLLVVVHSWSTGYQQEINIPYARWAQEVGWGYVQPDFRGVNDDPDATGSDLAVQDVLDAVDFAVAEGGVDPERVYVLGFSGGGMMSLLLAGRHAGRFAGAVAWVPIHDLTAWYAYNRDERPDAAYAGQILASCGGDPTADARAQASCAGRSPASVLDGAREAGLPVYLGAGLQDDVVPPSDTLRAFNALAGEEDRVPEAAVQAVAGGTIPADLQDTGGAETWFTPEDPAVLLARSSGPVTAVLFEGGHAMVYYPGLEWLARLDAES